MDAREWLGLEATDDQLRWELPVTPGIATSGGFMFGGCGLGASISALEGATGRPAVWATAQYLSFARPPDVVTFDVTIAVEGRQTTQARAVARVGDQEILTVNAALGERQFEAEGEWAKRPEVPPPHECPARDERPNHAESVMSRLDQRVADGRGLDRLDGTPGTGRSAMWMRLPELLEMSAAALGILGDYVPWGLSQALGLPAGGRSLDNTLRVVQLVPTDWVLLDVRVHGVANGFGHGLVHLWAEDGTLLATASQSAIVRFWRDR